MKKFYTIDIVLNKCKALAGRREFHKATGLKNAAKRFGILKECFDILDNKTLLNLTSNKINFFKKFEEAINQSKTIMEFRRNFPEFVWHLNKNLNKYKHRFIPQKFSTHQLVCKKILETLLEDTCQYNCRTALGNRKELDIFFEKYKLACEYNSWFWHSSLSVCNKDDIKIKLCKQAGITLLHINEPFLNAYVTFEVYVQDIKTQFKSLIQTINLVTNKQITLNDIDNININHEELLKCCYNYKDIEYIINTCNSYAEVRHKYNKIWQYLQKNKLLYVLNPVKKRDHRHMTKDQYITYILKECKTYSLFVKHKTYSFAYRRKYDKEIKQMFKTVI